MEVRKAPRPRPMGSEADYLDAGSAIYETGVFCGCGHTRYCHEVTDWRAVCTLPSPPCRRFLAERVR